MDPRAALWSLLLGLEVPPRNTPTWFHCVTVPRQRTTEGLRTLTYHVHVCLLRNDSRYGTTQSNTIPLDVFPAFRRGHLWWRWPFGEGWPLMSSSQRSIPTLSCAPVAHIQLRPLYRTWGLPNSARSALPIVFVFDSCAFGCFHRSSLRNVLMLWCCFRTAIYATHASHLVVSSSPIFSTDWVKAINRGFITWYGTCIWVAYRASFENSYNNHLKSPYFFTLKNPVWGKTDNFLADPNNKSSSVP